MGRDSHGERWPGAHATRQPVSRGWSSAGLGTSPIPRPSQLMSPQVPAEGGGPATPPLRQQEPVLSCVPHCYAQEVSRLAALPAGSYTVVPSTYLPDAEGTFTLTVATRIDRWASLSLPLLSGHCLPATDPPSPPLPFSLLLQALHSQP